ncbi:hypothetical protein Nepgr_003981 [Nepenthes gracilis]|uniref:Uncharacterized protein n=1 Tax=Nepenthes gracilis TaxID=150966 RepID=A0AAD3XEJ8_NEPGR|nr:hypothetical protein Nepgr_003981 [Nepenthes gracilis]
MRLFWLLKLELLKMLSSSAVAGAVVFWYLSGNVILISWDLDLPPLVCAVGCCYMPGVNRPCFGMLPVVQLMAAWAMLLANLMELGSLADCLNAFHLMMGVGPYGAALVRSWCCWLMACLLIGYSVELLVFLWGYSVIPRSVLLPAAVADLH